MGQDPTACFADMRWSVSSGLGVGDDIVKVGVGRGGYDVWRAAAVGVALGNGVFAATLVGDHLIEAQHA